MTLVRTQVYLPQEVYRQLKEVAKVKGVKTAELVREGVRMVLKKEVKKIKTKGNWQDFVGAVRLGKKFDGVELVKDIYRK